MSFFVRKMEFLTEGKYGRHMNGIFPHGKEFSPVKIQEVSGFVIRIKSLTIIVNLLLTFIYFCIIISTEQEFRNIPSGIYLPQDRTPGLLCPKYQIIACGKRARRCKMKPSQQKINSMSGKICLILKLAFFASGIVMILALFAIGILMFSGAETKSSFIAAFDVTANNGSTLSIAPRSLLLMFIFMLVDAVLISLAIFFVHAIFSNIRKADTPFTRQNTLRLKIIALIAAFLSIVGSCSDALVDYYTIGEPAWKINIAGLIMALILYCISLIFSYGCDLQQESDETL